MLKVSYLYPEVHNCCENWSLPAPLISKLTASIITPGGLQSKTPILSRNVDIKSIETVFFIATNGNQKHYFYQFLIRICQLLITFAIAAYWV